jgi:hypothetical protein
MRIGGSFSGPLKAGGCRDCDRFWRAYEHASHTYAVAIYMRETLFPEIGHGIVIAAEEARRQWACARETLFEHAFHHAGAKEAA